VQQTLRRALALWLPTVVASTLLAGLVYAAVQQNYRQSADDPQTQIARDAADRLSSGASPEQVVGTGRVDLSSSLAPFTIVYDGAGNPVAASGTLGGSPPTPPPGVLQRASDSGENSLTWEPRSGVREAVVVAPWSSNGSSGTVLVGRSLQEVEDREDRLTLMVGAAWIVVLFVSAAAAIAGSWLWGSGSRQAI
jgi:hypothetical protein